MRKFLITIGIAVGVLVPALVYATPSFDNSSSGSTSGSSHSTDLDVGPSANLVVCIAQNGASGYTLSDYKFAGQGMTLAGTITAPGTDNKAYVFYIIDPLTGTRAFTYNSSGIGGSMLNACASFIGAGAYESTAEYTSTGSTITATTTPITNEALVVGTLAIDGTVSANSGVTQVVSFGGATIGYTVGPSPADDVIQKFNINQPAAYKGLIFAGASEEGTSTGTSSAGTTSGVGYHDWLLVACVFLFFLSYATWPKIFKPVRTLFYGS